MNTTKSSNKISDATVVGLVGSVITGALTTILHFGQPDHPYYAITAFFAGLAATIIWFALKLRTETILSSPEDDAKKKRFETICWMLVATILILFFVGSGITALMAGNILSAH